MLTNESGERLYTTAELSEILHIPQVNVVELIRNKHLKADKQLYTVGAHTRKRYVITESAFNEYLSKKLDIHIKEKLKVLKQLKIELTYNQLEHMRECKTEFEIDAFYHDIITGKTRIK